MSGQIKDLETILPDNDTIIVSAAGVQYEIELFIPAAAALLVVNNSMLFQSLFKSDGIGATRDAVYLTMRILEIVFKRQFKNMTAEWIRKNITFAKALIIISKILFSVFHYFDQKRNPETVESSGEMIDIKIMPVLARVMADYGLTLDYVLFELTYPQVVLLHNESVFKATGKRDAEPIREETDDEIRAQFVKKPDGGWTVKK